MIYTYCEFYSFANCLLNVKIRLTEIFKNLNIKWTTLELKPSGKQPASCWQTFDVQLVLRYNVKQTIFLNGHFVKKGFWKQQIKFGIRYIVGRHNGERRFHCIWKRSLMNHNSVWFYNIKHCVRIYKQDYVNYVYFFLQM